MNVGVRFGARVPGELLALPNNNNNVNNEAFLSVYMGLA